MKARLAVREADNLKLEDLLDRLQEEKKRLTQRNNKLTANGQFLTAVFRNVSFLHLSPMCLSVCLYAREREKDCTCVWV